MTPAAETAKLGRMGRPPLNNKPTQVRLSSEARRRIETLVGARGMAEFIREAVDAELDRREKAARAADED